MASPLVSSLIALKEEMFSRTMKVATYLRLLGVERPTGRDWRGLAYGR